MKIKIDAAIFEKFPATKLGVLVGKNVSNPASPQELIRLMREIEKNLQSRLTLETVTTTPKIIDWREAYRAFGCKPSEYRSSVEALVRRILQGKELPAISSLVDAYNSISLKHLLPAGGGDLDAIEGTIVLTTATGSELFKMLGESEYVTIKSNEVIYRDDKEVICRAWNYRESEKTKLTLSTRNAYLILEGLEHTSSEELKTALSELKDLVSLFCGGSFEMEFLDTNNREASF